MTLGCPEARTSSGIAGSDSLSSDPAPGSGTGTAVAAADAGGGIKDGALDTAPEFLTHFFSNAVYRDFGTRMICPFSFQSTMGSPEASSSAGKAAAAKAGRVAGGGSGSCREPVSPPSRPVPLPSP